MTEDEMKENGSKHWKQQALIQVLRSEAEEGFKNIKYPICDKELYKQAYFAAAEPRENRIKELEDALEYTRKLYGDELEKAYKEINMLRQGYVWQDYDPGEGCYDDTHEGKWVKRWEPWRYIKDELPKIEIGYKVAVEVCYLNVYDNPCKMECDWKWILKVKCIPVGFKFWRKIESAFDLYYFSKEKNIKIGWRKRNESLRIRKNQRVRPC